MMKIRLKKKANHFTDWLFLYYNFINQRVIY
ncbi:Uncharacterised protein [Yersinia rohdei]|uniref:Uncharacterized protein n=1 Tax=Yersinia rohdei TaxID=29485 RepID=A0A0U1HPV5_YERRO|nr:Uncharacterised protein [Yersinia rohdei]